MKGKTRRLTSTLLALAMVFSLFIVVPLTASAADENDEDTCEVYDSGGNKLPGTHSLSHALAIVNDADVIVLLTDILVDGDLLIDNGKEIAISLDGFSLTINGNLEFEDSAIHFINDHSADPAYLTVGGDVITDSMYCAALIVDGNVVVSVGGDILAMYCGVDAQNGATVEVDGFILVVADSEAAYGVYANSMGTTVTVNEGVSVAQMSSGDAFGVYCHNGAKVTVNDDISVDGDDCRAYGVYCDGRDEEWVVGYAEVIVNGNVTADGYYESYGVECYYGGIVTVNGDVNAVGESGNTYGIACTGEEAIVTVNGDVSAGAGYYVYGVDCRAGGLVIVDGSVSAYGDSWSWVVGIDCTGVFNVNGYEGDLTEVFVKGDVIVTTENEYGCYGVRAVRKGQITIDGAIVTNNENILPIIVDNEEKDVEEDKDDPSMKGGYFQYSWWDRQYYDNYEDYYDSGIDVDEMTVVWVGIPVELLFEGPTEMTLEEGYAATSTSLYTLDGMPMPTVTQDTTYGDKITWNPVTERLDIDPGLDVGDYVVTLTASNIYGQSIVIIFTLTVTPKEEEPNIVPGPGTGGGSTTTTITISFNANGGVGTMTSDTVAASGDNYTIKANTFTRDGYKFREWNTKADGSGTAYKDKATIADVTESITLFAQWTLIPKLESDEHVRYIYGYPDGSVGPERPVTRAEAAIIFYRLIVADDKEDALSSSFTDVKVDVWYTQAIAYLEKYDIIVDSSSGRFRPNEAITRAEYAALACGFDNLDTSAPNAFPDVPADHWAVGYINSAAAKGWVEGFPDGTFQAEETITRAQLVTIINRMLDRRIELEDIPESAPVYTDLQTSHWAYCDFIEASSEHADYTRKANGYEIWD